MSVHTIPWWAGYHPHLAWDLYPDACFLKDHVLALPLDHLKTTRHIEFICRSLVDVVKST
jgi:hypothetical protein